MKIVIIQINCSFQVKRNKKIISNRILIMQRRYPTKNMNMKKKNHIDVRIYKYCFIKF